MAITGDQLAQLTARCGIGRCGASRCGAVITRDSMKSDGSYIWTKDYTLPSADTWTAIKEPKTP